VNREIRLQQASKLGALDAERLRGRFILGHRLGAAPLGGFAWRRSTARVQPIFKIILGNADAPLRELDDRRPSAFGAQSLQRSASDRRALRRLIQCQNDGHGATPSVRVALTSL